MRELKLLKLYSNYSPDTETGKVVPEEIRLSEEWLGGVAFPQQRMRSYT